ncbi:ABC-2 type transport system permease protein [Mycolicibacterium iranicum]|uniref:Transport permease protein n=1 Tax=Mycolicibacterium iranicum TaxID=912594 RepID=A0A839Q5T0_MYCIR|nr:ABC transporter permease [Mycolicibacterium iranicum]MBB2991420.1 ABC-2 type transport system permease protein [Mycolicibacterium iranicum]
MAIESTPATDTSKHRARRTQSDADRAAEKQLPSAVRIGFSRVVPELKMFYRRPEQLALTFSMPAIICLLLGSIFSADVPGTQTSTGAIIAASMLAYGILSTSFINLGIGIAADRETGALRRLRGTPATASSYFIGKIMLVAIASVAEAVIILALGVTVFGLHLPTSLSGWFTLTWVFLLGILSCSLLGILVSNYAGNAVSAAVLTNGPAVGLQFVSGTYVPLMVLPTWMLIIGSLFPVKWMAQGFRSVLLPPQMMAFEPAGSWEHGRIFLVLAAWSVGGLVACLYVFRWSDRS